MSKSYFKYLYQSKKILWNFLTLVFFAISFTPVLSDMEDGVLRLKTIVTVALSLSLILCFVLPAILFSVYQRRRSSDQYFALPLNRRTILVSTIGFSWFFVLMNWLGVTVLAHILMNAGFLQKWPLLILYMALAIGVLLLVNSLVFLVANNVFDGIIMTIAYFFIFFIVLFLEKSFTSSIIAGQGDWGVGWLGEVYLLFSPVMMIINDYLRVFMTMGSIYDFYPAWFTISLLVMYGLVALIGLRRYFICRSSENAELVSNDPMAYPLIIHVYLGGLMFALAFQYWKMERFLIVLSLLLLLLAYVIAMFVYRRKIALSRNNVIVFVLTMAIGFGFAFMGMHTKGFGLANQYQLKVGETLIYEINNDDYRTRNIHIRIPTHEFSKYQEVIDMMEKYRKEEINQYYQLNSDKKVYGYLRVRNDTKTDKFANLYRYAMHRTLNEKEIEILKKYPSIVEFEK